MIARAHDPLIEVLRQTLYVAGSHRAHYKKALAAKFQK
jgi:hypothetical protein